MPQALIQINAVTGSDTDLPINVLVQLDNVNSGGEITYNWSILDQPPGAVDALSSAVIQNPTFTPKKEGSYLIELIVNVGLVTESRNRVVAAVRQLKTRIRVPAAGETLEADASDGWATDVNSILRLLDSLRADPDLLVGTAGFAGAVRGWVVRIGGVSLIKVGLPGEESVPDFNIADPAVDNMLNEPLYMVERGVDGGAAPAPGDLILVRRAGFSGAIPNANLGAGPFAVNSPLYLDANSNLDIAPPPTPGSAPAFRRVLGRVRATVVGFTSVVFDGSIQPTVTVPLLYGNTAFPVVAGTGFMDPCNMDRIPLNTEVATLVPEDGVIDHFVVFAVTDPVTDTQVLTVRINGVPTLLTVTLPAGGPGGVQSDLTPANAAAVLQGDRVSVEIISGAAITAGATEVVATLRYRTTTTTA